MTFKEKFDNCKSWKDRIIIIELFHLTMSHKIKSKPGKWSVRKTAKYFCISLGACSENLKLASVKDDLEHCNTRKEALKLLSR